MADRAASDDGSGAFVDRLGELLLLSFASGQSVEGDWYLVNGHRMIPDLAVSIARVDGSVCRPPDEGRATVTDTRPFDAKLEGFLLTEFADGESIEGTWELRYPRPELPAWDVDVDLDEVTFESVPDGFTHTHGNPG